MVLFKNKEEKIDVVHPGYEEEERRTPKAGYILLLAMFVAALFFGWRAIDDLQDVPTKPERLSGCASQFVTYDWEDRGRYGYEYRYYEEPPVPYSYAPGFNEKGKIQCGAFSSFEKKYGIPAIFEKRNPNQDELDQLRSRLDRVKSQIFDLEKQYNLGLQEKQAQVDKYLFPIPPSQQNIESLRTERVNLTSKISVLEAYLKPLDEELKSLYQQVMRDYKYAWRWYEFKVFLLESIFVFPFFWFVFLGYRRLLAKNSPYTIIFTALVGVASVLALRIIFTWFWSLFLARLIETLWKFIQSFALLKSLVFYGGMVLSILLFGGAVYLLQKRIFDPRRVAIRRLRDKKCPNCQTVLDLANDFCPNCGRKLKEKCPACGEYRWSDFRFCQNCRSEKQS